MKLAHTLRLLALLATVTLPTVALAQPPYQQHRVNDNWAYGYGSLVSSPETSTQHWGYVNATAQYNANGTYESTSVNVSENIAGGTPFTFGYRSLTCPVDRRALSINPTRAKLSAVLDASASDCFTDGYICDYSDFSNPPVCTPWSFAGPVAVSGDWQDSLYSIRETINRQTGYAGTTTRETCQAFQGDNSKGGFAIGNHVFSFDPGFGYGYYRHISCSRMQR